MRVAIVGCPENRAQIIATLRSLSYKEGNDFVPPSGDHFFEATDFEDLCRRVFPQYEPAVVISDAHVRQGTVVISFEMLAEQLRHLHRPLHRESVRVRMIVVPVSSLQTSQLEAQTRECGVPFLPDPADAQKLSALLDAIAAEKKDGCYSKRGGDAV